MGFVEEVAEEAKDFFEDFFELLAERTREKKPALEVGAARPAFFFAQRIESILAVIFGASILVSAVTATFLGFSTIGELLGALINSWWGRILMGVIGSSYLVTALWRLLNIRQKM